MKKNTNAPIRSRRGVTIAEVTIALVIISIISAAALSLVMHSVRVEKQSFSVIEAEIAAENTLACFRYAENKDEFAEALCKTDSYELQEDGTLLLVGNGYTVSVYADYTNRYFTYIACYDNGEPIYSFRYPRNDTEGGAT